ncbi:twin arginine-targeting protein translocase, TatA/E family [Loktanella sp. DSM 29012]|nr:twin arginine-targeting protein translocase, TatA/E family [Loktanella sp. DSM 29012]
MQFRESPFKRAHRVLCLLGHYRRGKPPAARKGEFEMLNNIGLPGLLLIAVVVLVLFGRGKISSLMGEVGKGITAFKRGVDDGKKELDDSFGDARDVTPDASVDKADKDKV